MLDDKVNRKASYDASPIGHLPFAAPHCYLGALVRTLQSRLSVN